MKYWYLNGLILIVVIEIYENLIYQNRIQKLYEEYFTEELQEIESSQIDHSGKIKKK